MRSLILASLAAFVAVPHIAAAQLTQQQSNDAQRFGQNLQALDRAAQERNSTPNANGSWMPPPLPATLPPEQIYPLPFPLACMSANQATPVQTEPVRGAPVIGYTLSVVAVPHRPPVGAYRMILFANGRVGYVPTGALHPFVSPAHAGGTCKVAGLRANGAPVLEMH